MLRNEYIIQKQERDMVIFMSTFVMKWERELIK